jgi:hypothetical protein
VSRGIASPAWQGPPMRRRGGAAGACPIRSLRGASERRRERSAEPAFSQLPNPRQQQSAAVGGSQQVVGAGRCR